MSGPFNNRVINPAAQCQPNRCRAESHWETDGNDVLSIVDFSVNDGWAAVK